MKPKRIISLLVAVCMMIAMLPASALPAFAADTIVVNGIKYEFDGIHHTAKVKGVVDATASGFPAGGKIVIPGKVDHDNTEYTVTSVFQNAFQNNANITSVELPETVTEIGQYAFSGCTNLSHITVSGTQLKKVANKAFMNCSNLTGDIGWLSTVEEIGPSAFEGCKSLTGNIDISSLTSLGGSAFKDCSSLTGGITIPSTLETIENNVFNGCTGLMGTLTIPAGVTTINQRAFYNCTGLSGDLTIPSTVTTIGEYVFYKCGNLKNLSILGNVTSIGNSAFRDCTGLTGDFTLPASLTGLGNNVFDGSGIARLVLPKTLKNATINGQSKDFYYDGTRDELASFLKNNNITITGLNADTMKINNSRYLYYNCDVTFDTDGGEPESDPQNEIYRMSLLDSSKVNTPSKEGYVFDGWYYNDSTGEETKFDPANDKVTDSMTLKAKWTVPAAVTVSGLPDGELAQGKQYPFTVAIDPKDDTGNGRLNVTLAGSGDRLYRRLSSGELEPMTGYSLNIALTENEYQYVLIPGQTGPDSLNVTLTKNGITDPRDTVAIDFTVREYQNAEVSLEGLDNVTFKQGEPQEFSVRVTPNDDSGKACLDFGKDNADIEYQENGEWKQMPEDGLTIDLDEGEQVYALRYTPQLGGKNQSLRVTVKPVDSDFGKNETTIDIAAKAKKSLTLTGGTVKVNGEEVALDADKECVIEEGSTVEVTFDKSILSDAQVFDQWSIKPDSVLNAVDPKAETITFKMPAEKVTIEAMTRDASIQEEPNILGTAAVIGIGVAGTAVLGYQGYMIGTELYLKNVMPAGAAIPQNYGELALLVWTDAGKPAPAAVLAADATDEQKALTWAVENQLIPADKAADASVTRWEVIQTWNQEQEMKG